MLALERGFEILRCFRADDPDLSNAEIVSRTGLTKATVSRLTNTLTRLGYLAYAERTGTYRLSAGLITLAAPLLSSLNIRERARPMMRKLAEDSGASVALAAPSNLDVVCIEQVPGSAVAVLHFTIGARLPIANTAMGRAYLSALDEETFARTMAAILRAVDDPKGVERRILAGIEQVHRDGFCVSLGEWRKEIHAAAAPLDVPGLPSPLVLNCGAPSFLLTETIVRERIGPRLVEIARTLGADAN